jgi:hypothetical protein
MDRSNRVWLTLVAAALAWISLLAAGAIRAANSPPLANTWNISSSGKADSSGALLFRITPPGEADPVEITVYVLSGANETGVASSIRRADIDRHELTTGERVGASGTGWGRGRFGARRRRGVRERTAPRRWLVDQLPHCAAVLNRPTR